MLEQVFRRFQARPLALNDGFAQLLSIPVHDNCGEQVQAGHAEVPAFRGPIPDFALTTDPQGVL